MKTRFTIDCIRGGQPRPYADSEYEYVLTLESTSWKAGDNEFKPWDTADKQKIVIPILKACARHWEDEPPNWASTEMKSLSKIGAGVWKLILVEAYTG